MVTGVDISPELLAAAADLSGHIRAPIEFRVGDAEQLPFDNATFDGVISTSGVVFAINQAAAAAELARVCRSGGRLVLATWAPGGAVAEFFRVIAQHSDAPPPPSSPLAWGDPVHVEQLLGRAFEQNSNKASAMPIMAALMIFGIGTRAALGPCVSSPKASLPTA